MGYDSDAHLAYGYDLGGKEHDWKFTKKGIPYGELYPHDYLSWFKTEDNEDVEDFAESLTEELLRSAGWEETDWQTDETYFERKNALTDTLGIKVLTYGSYECTGYILYAKKFSVEWGAIPVLPYVDPTWNTMLNAAIDTLGIVPTQTEPKWILASFYG